MTPDGYFKSGDIGTMDERGFFKIVDRKKDMIWSAASTSTRTRSKTWWPMPRRAGVRLRRCADDKTGEAVKLVIVKKNPDLTEAQVREYCKANLTGYKQPKVVEFRTELPKTPVGKILRRELRDKK
jgi:long-chain acyl-CoA synthetase